MKSLLRLRRGAVLTLVTAIALLNLERCSRRKIGRSSIRPSTTSRDQSSVGNSLNYDRFEGIGDSLTDDNDDGGVDKENEAILRRMRREGKDALVELEFSPGPLGLGFKSNLVVSVRPGSQGARFGVEPGWTLTEVNRQSVDSASDLKLAMEARASNRGKRYFFTFRRPPSDLVPVLKKGCRQHLHGPTYAGVGSGIDDIHPPTREYTQEETTNFKKAIRDLVQTPERLITLMQRLGYRRSEIEDITSDVNKSRAFFEKLKENRHWVETLETKGIWAHFENVKKHLRRGRVVVSDSGDTLEMYADPVHVTSSLTGCNVHPAAIAFADWANRKGSEYWNGKRVLELGSGAGLAGLALARLGATVTMTDVREMVPLLRENIELQRDRLSSPLPAAEELQWGERGTYDGVVSDEYDVVIGTALTYSETLFPALMHLLSTLIFEARSRGKKGTPVVILAAENDSKTHALFMEQAVNHFDIQKCDQVSGTKCSDRVPQAFCSDLHLRTNAKDISIYVLTPVSWSRSLA